ncbi:hypothetical protein Q3G72_010497 [Acer saccharum]|nr:hypothetical protein Q3G72_010497 [Acer saccharum]
MTLPGAFNALKSSNIISWKSTGRLQQTLAGCIERSGKTLHSGEVSTVRIWPEYAGQGRIEIGNLDSENQEVEVPIFDGSASTWVEAIEQVGMKETLDQCGKTGEKLAPYLNEPVYVWKNDSFVAAFPSPKLQITYGIDFPQVPAIGRQWFSSAPLDDSFYEMHIASSRTFCIYEEVESMRNLGLIKGGSLENAIVCSASEGWLNPPLRFHDEPCRHKVLDLVGDLSLFACSGSQGVPVAHIVAFKGSHALHADFARCLSRTGTAVENSFAENIFIHSEAVNEN